MDDVDYYINEYCINMRDGEFDEDDCMEYVEEHVYEQIRYQIRDFMRGLSSFERQHEYNFFDIFEEDVADVYDDGEKIVYTVKDSLYEPHINKMMAYKENLNDAEWKLCSLGNEYIRPSNLPEGVKVLYDEDNSEWINVEIEHDSPFVLKCFYKSRVDSPVKIEFDDVFNTFLSNFKGHIGGHLMDDQFTKHPIRYITLDEDGNYVRTFITWWSYAKGSEQYDMLCDGIESGKFSEDVLESTIISYTGWLRRNGYVSVSNDEYKLCVDENLYIDILLNKEDGADKVDVIAYSNISHKYNRKYLLKSAYT